MFQKKAEDLHSKIILRKRILALRDLLKPDEREREELLICEKVLGDPEYRARKQVFIYAAYRSEVSTDMIIREALSDGHRVYVPRVTEEENASMGFFRILDANDLAPGYRGIPEPVGGAGFDGAFDDVYMILPGAVFDLRGRRIGYGRGFYDRYLKGKKAAFKAGICFSCQIVEQVPSDPWDTVMDRVISGGA